MTLVSLTIEVIGNRMFFFDFLINELHLELKQLLSLDEIHRTVESGNLA